MGEDLRPPVSRCVGEPFQKWSCQSQLQMLVASVDCLDCNSVRDSEPEPLNYTLLDS